MGRVRQVEKNLELCIVDAWPSGFGDHLFKACGLPLPAPTQRPKKKRLPATDIAWREFDLITVPFQLDGKSCRLVMELKHGAIGYGSIGQVIFYKHVLAPRHEELLKADRLVFVLIAATPNPKRWSKQGKLENGRLESDAEEFVKLFRCCYWPDPDIHALSYDQLGLSRSDDDQWHWSTAQEGDCAAP